MPAARVLYWQSAAFRVKPRPPTGVVEGKSTSGVLVDARQPPRAPFREDEGAIGQSDGALSATELIRDELDPGSPRDHPGNIRGIRIEGRRHIGLIRSTLREHRYGTEQCQPDADERCVCFITPCADSVT